MDENCTSTDTAEKQLLLEDQQEGEDKAKLTTKLKGVIAAITYVILQTVSGTSVQLLERSIPDFELNAMRSGLGLVIACGAILWRRELPEIPKSEIFATMIYSVISAITSLFMYIGSSLVPAASGQCTLITINIVSGIILFSVFCKEKPTLLVLITSSISIVGLCMVIQPDKLVSCELEEVQKLKNETFNINITFTSDAVREDKIAIWNLLWYIFPALSGLGYTLDTLWIKKFPYLGQHITDVLFWCLVSNILISIAVMVIFEAPVLPENLYNTFLILCHGIPFVFNLMCFIYAAKTISGNTCNMIYSSTTVLMLVAQYTILSSILPGHRNWIEVVGVLLVTFASGFSSTVEVIKPKQESVKK